VHKYTTFENMVLSHWLTRDIATVYWTMEAQTL